MLTLAVMSLLRGPPNVLHRRLRPKAVLIGKAAEGTAAVKRRRRSIPTSLQHMAKQPRHPHLLRKGHHNQTMGLGHLRHTKRRKAAILSQTKFLGVSGKP